MKQDRAIATRAQVLRAAAEVFDQHGYAAATISQILQAAEVTKGAMYFHFASKEQLAEAIIAEQNGWRANVQLSSSDPLSELIELSHAFVDALRTDPLLKASIRLTLERGTFGEDAQPSSYEGWRAASRSLLKDACDAGLLRPGTDTDELSYLVTGCFSGLQLMSEAMSGRSDLHRHVDAFWTVMANGFASPAGQRAVRDAAAA